MIKQRYSRRAAAALIVSPDPLAAALVGAAVEVAGFRAEFPLLDESLTAVLARVRPSHVLLDCRDRGARDETVLGHALMTDARPFFFGSAADADEMRATAARYGARLIVLPDDVTRLREILTRRPSPIRDQIAR